MAYLDAPILNLQLPAFAKADGTNDTILKVPFQFPLGVMYTNITAIKYWIYSDIGTLIKSNEIAYAPSTVAERTQVSIIFNESVPGKFYKIQIAFKQNSIESALSSIAAVKCIAKGHLTATPDNHEQSWTINYAINSDDQMETVVYYQLAIYTSQSDAQARHNALEISPKLLYSQETTNKYILQKFYDFNNTYYVVVEYWTKNNYNARNLWTWRLTSTNANLAAPTIAKHVADGAFEISGSSGGFAGYLKRKDNITNCWQTITTIPANSSSILYYDKAIESGIGYQYGLFMKNNSTYYTPIVTSVSTLEFEDMFITDTTGRQLCIRFNPQVSTFKTNVLEQKVDTLGSQFPFIFRNGDVAYKELQISGLISYELDEEGRFYNVGQSVGNLTRATTPNAAALSSSNSKITMERKFKLEVEQWLRNGEPKLLRSPTEGNYIVQLIGVTLQPVDGLGRMLHSFQATAYEIDAYTPENLKKYGFIVRG